jgi:hypothetical protein
MATSFHMSLGRNIGLPKVFFPGFPQTLPLNVDYLDYAKPAFSEGIWNSSVVPFGAVYRNAVDKP